MIEDTDVTWERLAAARAESPGERIAYADESSQQFGILRLPAGAGPHRVAVIVHGGCWQAEFDCRHVERMAEVLTARGLATWVLEYRRLGQAGGGWPGTLLDVARGVDHLRALAPLHALDARRVVAVGHSAGGQLALWLAARAALPAGSDLYVRAPLAVSGVIALAAISDLRRYALGRGSCNAAVVELMGGAARDRAERYALASPIELLPLRAPVRLLHGARDAIVPLAQSRRFAAAAAACGSQASLVPIANAGHFDLVAPFSSSWPTVERHIMELARGD